MEIRELKYQNTNGNKYNREKSTRRLTKQMRDKNLPKNPLESPRHYKKTTKRFPR